MFKTTILIAGATAASGSLLYSNSTAAQEFMFKTFVQEYGRNYHSSEEESHRFKVFVENLKVIDERNANEKKANGDAVHGM